jgi:lincosamide nucleotidyltransferase A/C/D/E
MTAEPGENSVETTAAQVLTYLDRLAEAGVAAWVDGGWGVDALLGEQTRPHEDLDLVVALADAAKVERAFAPLGFHMALDERPVRFVLCDEAGHRLDCHTVTFVENGDGVQVQPDGSDFHYPAEGFAARGRIGGRAVACLSVTTQVLCHLGYEPDAQDRHDMRLLHERLGVSLPSPYAEERRSGLSSR